MLQDVFRSGV